MPKSLTLLLLFVTLSLACSGQTSQTDSTQDRDAKDRKIASLQAKTASFRPKVSLQQALIIAEDYIIKENIDIRPYWLYRAIYILVGDEKTPDEKKVPAWHFWWVSERGTSGDDVEIMVYMDGTAYRAPSM